MNAQQFNPTVWKPRLKTNPTRWAIGLRRCNPGGQRVNGLPRIGLLLVALGVQLESILPSLSCFTAGRGGTESIELQRPMVQQFSNVGRHTGERTTGGAMMNTRGEQLNRKHGGPAKPHVHSSHFFCIRQKHRLFAKRWRCPSSRKEPAAQWVTKQTPLGFNSRPIKHPIHNERDVAFFDDVIED